ncbi:MAG: type I-C CRISPR-associated protein Cas8c/Csd1 [Ruminiclostridium sp.]|nr:type I-C CRISPR-associated protein Cas8c/Csd1 [Ruminiclostridium sp.]MBQ5317797.1 type I-C CRISPR-associated protein Cas8c/Csd1 [Oscillospiraceae bacterium]
MSWTEQLYRIYEQHYGKTDDTEPTLLPVAHSTANAQIELTISENGDFISAEKIDKSDAVTIIPVTEDSGARSSGVAPHPLMDKLIYIAKDYPQLAEGKKNDNTGYFKAYQELLTQWEKSDYNHPAVAAVSAYVKKGIVISDLVEAKVLETNENGKLNPDVKIAGIAQPDCFVRFRILYRNGNEPRTWADRTLQDAYISFNSTRMGKTDLCYALGEELPVTYKHPSKIRNAGDKAKLISSNDESGFTYRGRFANKEQALSVSYEFSQKAHNALKWLIARQGIAVDNTLTLVVWESALKQVPDITTSFSDVFADLGFDFDDTEQLYGDALVSAYKDKLQKTLFGHSNRLDPNSETIIMALDSATTGRLSMPIYTALSTSEFYKSVCKWHDETAWIRYNGKKKMQEVNSFSLSDIAECAFGTEQGKFISCKPEVKRDVYIRLIPCVIEGRRIPQDIVNALVTRATSPQMYSERYNWRRVLEVTCGMIRKNKIEHKEECSMALDKECRNRDYLFGRLLAVAEAAERSTYAKEEDRITNAMRFFNAFANRPSTGWDTIYKRLIPYFKKMENKNRIRYLSLIEEISAKMSREDFADNTKLKPEFLHAYSCQLNDIYTPKSEKAEETNDTQED